MSEDKHDIILSSVFCSYRGNLYVHDMQGNRVENLCGDLTLEKHEEIEKLRTDATEFDGLEHYRRIVSEKEEEWQLLRTANILAQGQQATMPSRARAQGQAPKTFSFTVENTSNKTLPVVLFGAVDNIHSINYGNENGITIDKHNDYTQFLAESMNRPFNVKQITVLDTHKTGGDLEIRSKNAFGAVSSQKMNISGNGSPFTLNPSNITQQKLNLILDGCMEFRFNLFGNSKTHIQLTT